MIRPVPNPKSYPGVMTPAQRLAAHVRVPERLNKYSKRDYEIFAHMLKKVKPLTSVDNKDPANLAWAAVVAATAELFHEDNARFDTLTFVKRIHEHEVLLDPECPTSHAGIRLSDV